MGLYNFLGAVLLGLSSSAPRSTRLHTDKLIEMAGSSFHTKSMGKIIADPAKKKRTTRDLVVPPPPPPPPQLDVYKM